MVSQIFYMLERAFQYISNFFFKILKLGADGFLTRFFDFQFWSVAPPGSAIFFLSLKLIIDQPPTLPFF